MNKLMMIALALLLTAGTSVLAGPGSRILWSPVEWTACETVVAPWGSSVSEVFSSLRRNGIPGGERRGDVENGTFSLAVNDQRRGTEIELVFDTAGRLNGASTWHSTSSAATTQDFVQATIGRLAASGAKVVTRDTDGAELRLVCNGTTLTLNVGIDGTDASRAFVVVMTEPTRETSGGLTHNVKP